MTICVSGCSKNTAPQSSNTPEHNNQILKQAGQKKRGGF